VNLSTDARLIEVHLDFRGTGNLFAFRATPRIFALLLGHADRQQPISRIHVRPGGRRTWRDCICDYSL
jgi:hypothetical protein